MELPKDFGLDVLDIVDMCLKINDLSGIRALVDTLQNKVGVSGFIVGRKENYDENLVEDSCITSFGITPAWLDLYKKMRLDRVDPVAHAAFSALRPVHWEEVYRLAGRNSIDFISMSRDHGLIEGMSCASRANRFNGAATCVSAIFDTHRISQLQLLMLERILPHFNEVIAQPVLGDHQELTAREIEILQWIKEGKSSWEIGIILNISERTVKFHLNNAYKKLDVHTRAQAIARAIKLGIICL